MPTKRKPEPGDLDFNWDTMDPNTVDRLLNEAKLALAQADAVDVTSQNQGGGSAEQVANIPASLAALQETGDKRGLARRITEPLAGAGQMAQGMALPAGAMQPAIGAALGLGGTLATVPDYLRRMIAPEEGEDFGAMEGGLTAAGVVPLMRPALKGLKAATPFIGPLGDVAGADMMAGRALAYGGGAGARPTARAAATPIDKLMASPSFANLPKGNVSKAAPLKLSGKLGPTEGPLTFGDSVRDLARRNPDMQGPTTFADAVRGEAARVKSPFERMSAAGQFRGDRTTGQFKEGAGGLSDLIAGRIRPHEMPWEPVALPQPLSPFERLAARSRERFGKKYRKE